MGHFDRASFVQFGHVFALLILSSTAHGSTHPTAALAIRMIERASETGASQIHIRYAGSASRFDHFYSLGVFMMLPPPSATLKRLPRCYWHCRYSQETASLHSSPPLGDLAAVLLLFHFRFSSECSS